MKGDSSHKNGWHYIYCVLNHQLLKQKGVGGLLCCNKYRHFNLEHEYGRLEWQKKMFFLIPHKLLHAHTECVRLSLTDIKYVVFQLDFIF